MYFRFKNQIIVVDGSVVIERDIYPSINSAKRANRTLKHRVIKDSILPGGARNAKQCQINYKSDSRTRIPKEKDDGKRQGASDRQDSPES